MLETLLDRVSHRFMWSTLLAVLMYRTLGPFPRPGFRMHYRLNGEETDDTLVLTVILLEWKRRRAIEPVDQATVEDHISQRTPFRDPARLLQRVVDNGSVYIVREHNNDYVWPRWSAMTRMIKHGTCVDTPLGNLPKLTLVPPSSSPETLGDPTPAA